METNHFASFSRYIKHTYLCYTKFSISSTRFCSLPFSPNVTSKPFHISAGDSFFILLYSNILLHWVVCCPLFFLSLFSCMYFFFLILILIPYCINIFTFFLQPTKNNFWIKTLVPLITNLLEKIQHFFAVLFIS